MPFVLILVLLFHTWWPRIGWFTCCHSLGPTPSGFLGIGNVWTDWSGCINSLVISSYSSADTADMTEVTRAAIVHRLVHSCSSQASVKRLLYHQSMGLHLLHLLRMGRHVMQQRGCSLLLLMLLQILCRSMRSEHISRIKHLWWLMGVQACRCPQHAVVPQASCAGHSAQVTCLWEVLGQMRHPLV